MSEKILLFIAGFIIFSIVILVFLKRIKKNIIATPTNLATKILRNPERILIDVPYYVSILQESTGYDFLLETEIALASIGELQTRRQFLIKFAQVIRSPSLETVNGLTNFLFHIAPQNFRDALRWDGKCDNAMHFLEFMQHLFDALEKGRILKDFQKVSRKKRRHSPKNLSKGLQGVDEKIMGEWFDLHSAVYKAITSWQAQSRSETRKHNGIPHFSSVSLIDEDKVPHLLPFLIASREVCKSIQFGVTDVTESV